MSGTAKLFLNNWEELTSDRSILQNVSGVRLEFDSQPVQSVTPRPYVCNAEQTNVIDSKVKQLLAKGVLVKVNKDKDIFISNIFLRPKPDGKWRMIIDLSELNKFLTKHHFKMEHLEVASQMLFPGAWMASIDLQEAYYAIPIHPDDRKYLCFQWKNEIYKFNCLPFGLASAPWLFTKTLKPIFAEFHKKGFQGFGYIDDSFIMAETKESCQEAVDFLTEMFPSLGFRVHPKKSILEPTQELVFLGYILNSIEMTVSPPLGKKEKVILFLQKMITKTNPKIREVASLIGTLNDLCKGSEYGHAHVKSLEIQKNRALFNSKKGFDGIMSWNHYCITEMQWWLDNIMTSLKHIRMSSPDLVLETDASKEGWGASFGTKSTGSRWSQEESEEHINVLELKAVLFSLRSFCDSLKRVDILIKSDNTTAVAYLNHGGGTKSTKCNKIAKQIWSWCEQREIWLFTTHVPGILNVEADFESRNFSENTEWMLNPSIFQEIVHEWGTPAIDLFASRHNNQLHKYVSWVPDPFAMFYDAFSQNWNKFSFVYVFPPFRLLTRTLQKIRAEKVTAIVVAPDWPAQPWFPIIINRARQLKRFPRKQGNLLRDNAFQTNNNSLQNIPLLAALL